MFYLKLVILPALVALVKCDLPLDIEESVPLNTGNNEIYRLPEDLEPIHYDVEITPYFETSDNKEAFTFDGIVKLTAKVVKENVSAIIIQENVREIQTVSLKNSNDEPVELDPSNSFERIREYQFLKINLRSGTELKLGDIYYLTVGYVGNINETPLSRGVFRGSYKDDNGKLHWYAAIHLQPTHSRQAFPSLDEPGFKSTFDITINRPAHFTETYSNMRIKESIRVGDRVKEVFHTTPIMSAYLVSFHISEQFTVIADNNNATHSYRILARPNAAGQGDYALEIGPPVTEWLENYLGISYYTMGKDMKNDQIAVPDWASGATENWGLVSYREGRLLYKEGETNAQDKMSIGTITAHELGHKWFGNLITCRWWNNVWINEGFASYFEYFAMDGVDRNMDLEDQFNVRYVQNALSSDASTSTRALEHTVNSPTEVTGHFSGISYTKGAGFLNMLKHYIGEDTFKKALNYFLVEKSYQHAFPSDLYKATAEAVREDEKDVTDIEPFMKYWVEQPGYPVLDVDVDFSNNVIKLTQERFFISPSASQTDQVWPLPITFTTGIQSNWENPTTFLLTSRTRSIEIKADETWYIFNVKQRGLYRVNYNKRNWEKIADELKSDASKIHHLNRAQIADDVFALMRSEKLSFDLGFKVLSFLKTDTSFYSWFPAISGLTWIRNRFLHLPEYLKQFDEILYEYLDAVIDDLGYNVHPGERFIRTLHRFSILSFACNIGHEGCIKDALTKFNNFIENNVSVNPNVRRHVMCQGLLHGGYDEWTRVYQQKVACNNAAAELEYLRSLGCTTHSQAVQRYLQMILSDEVKAQDRSNAFSYILMGSRANAKPVLEFFKTNYPEIRQKVVLQSAFESVMSNIASYLDEDGLVDMEQWLRQNQAVVPSASVGLSAINSARSNMQWGVDQGETVIRAANDAMIVAGSSLLLLITSILLLLRG